MLLLRGEILDQLVERGAADLLLGCVDGWGARRCLNLAIDDKVIALLLPDRHARVLQAVSGARTEGDEGGRTVNQSFFFLDGSFLSARPSASPTA